MITTIVHLSDIHIKSEQDDIFNKLPALVRAIKAETDNSNNVIVLTTGDIAFSGKKNEYEHAKKIFHSILDCISCDNKQMIFAPGNHDCFHGDNEKKAIRETLIKAIIEDKDKIPAFEGTICEAQNNYHNFVTEITGEAPTDLHCCLHSLNIPDKNTIDIFSFNSAWMSEIKETPGKLLPYKYETVSTSDAPIKICAMHHTPNWFSPEERREFRRTIEGEVNIVFTGHEHEFYGSVNNNLDGIETLYVEGQVLQESHDTFKSGFNTIRIDTAGLRYKVTAHSYTENIYTKTDKTNDWTSLDPVDSKNNISPKQDFIDYLEDPGVLYMHPRKKELTLSDIYIHPDLRDLDEEKKASNTICVPLVDSSELLSQTPIKAILLGEEKSGRTSFCKRIGLHTTMYNKIPLFIHGSDIKSHKLDVFKKLLNKIFKKQYGKKQLDRFEQTDSSSITLIIDDFNKSRLNYKHKALFLSTIESHYDNIIVTADDLFRIEELVTEEIQDFARKFRFYQIEPFGHLLRSKLISKWNLLGQELYISNEELTRLNDQAKNTIDTVIGKNYVPSFPFFLITILNSMNDHSKSLSESSYGYYYDYLITGALKQLSRIDEDIDAQYNYLTEFSFCLFENGTYSLSEVDFSDFHKWYCDEYALALDHSKYVHTLTKSKIISQYGDEYSFKYKYYYYYFLARYIARHLSEEKSQNIVKDMCSSLHLDESSNVIMFLTHLSKNPFVLEQVLDNSKQIFSDNTPTTMHNDIEIINQLVSKLPEIELKECDVDEYREEKYKLKDKAEQQKFEMPKEIDDNDDTHKLLISLQKAVKHQEIIGQILKNYYGSLKATTKTELCNEAFDLCLRALTDFYNILNDNITIIVEGLKSIITESDKVKDDKIDATAKKELFHICEHISYCFMKKISSSIGSEKLEETYRGLVKKNDTVAYEMIELAIKLDFFRTFPVRDVQKLCKKLETNILPYSVLKRLVINYLYMFPVPIQTRQQICDATNISMNCQRAIEATTRQKKKS